MDSAAATPSPSSEPVEHTDVWRHRGGWFRVLAWGRGVVRALARTDFQGQENLPRRGGFVVVANHMSALDPLVVGDYLYSAGYPPHFLAKQSLFEVPVVGRVLTGARQVPVLRGSSHAGDSLAAARRALAEGSTVVVYPEGTLTRDPDLWPMRGRPGAARLAIEAGVPIVPVAHWGAQLIVPPYGKPRPLPRRTVHVQAGPAIDLAEFAERSVDAATLHEATEVVMNTLARMVGRLRGATPPATRWDPAAHRQNTTGRFGADGAR